ncbi:MAG: DUF1684 domain-containing protein [Acidimicrobiia bacterium]|nr:DUF1684 domain-containing protein [Acidimicrobiia bacterium]MDH3470607.1 DUF1684 domain-containing protein [Acidimicrobiia bacterium]
MKDVHDTLDLLDYRRRVLEFYSEVRAGGAGEPTWTAWRTARDRIFAHHPQSALDAAQRVSFRSLPYFDYDPAWRFEVEVEPVDTATEDIAHSDGREHTGMSRFGVVRFAANGQDLELALYWLEEYSGGVFLSFRDATNGTETYGGGRYLLDSAKGADLGNAGTKIVLDFNYAYHPSCFHNEVWSCPLAPPRDRLDVAVTAGERS